MVRIHKACSWDLWIGFPFEYPVLALLDLVKLIFCRSGHRVPYGTPRATRPSLIKILAKSSLFVDHRDMGSGSSFEVLQVGDM